MEWICKTVALVAGTEYGHIVGIFFHPVECDLFGDFHAGSSGTSTYYLLW